MLSINRLSIRYNASVVLNDVSFSLNEGEIGCLLGPSGCGKTTLLRTICGFIKVNHGEVWMGEELISSSTIHQPIQQRNIGMVFQDYALFPHLTVEENLAFGLHNMSDQGCVTRVLECLQLVKMVEFAKRMPHELSGGQKQRVALARALAPKPRLLLMDEPFSSLDLALRESLAIDVRRILKTENITALLVTHDQNEAFALADNIGVFNEGELHQWGQAKTLYHSPASRFVGTFIGDGVVAKSSQMGNVEPILIRPEHIVINAQGPFQGVIVSKLFRGDHFLYQLNTNIPTLETDFVLAKSELAQDINVNDTVKFLIDFEQITRFQDKDKINH